MYKNTEMINNYNQLSLNKYYEIMDVLKEDMDIDSQVKILSIITNMTENEIINLRLSKYEELLDSINFLYEPLKPKKHIPRKMVINGNNYILLKSVDKMTAGQYIDIQSYYNNNLGYEYILSALVVPEGKKYGEGYDVQDVVNDILELDVQTCIDVCFFFRKKLLNSIRTTLIYLGWMIKKVKIPQKKQELMEVRKILMDKVLELSGI